MQAQTETREIDGLTVTSTPLPARRANRLLTRLGALIAPLGDLIAGAQTGANSFADVDLQGLGAALGGALSQVQGDAADAMITQTLVATTVIVDGRRVDLSSGEAIDVVFQGRLGTMYKVLGFALEVNFRDFFDVARSRIAEALGAAARVRASASPSDSSQTGSSTG